MGIWKHLSTLVTPSAVLDLGDAFRREIDDLVLFIDDEVAGLFPLDAHDGIDLGQVLHVRAALHLFGQDIARLVDLGGFSALSGDDKGRSRFVDQDGVDLVDDRVVQFAKDELLFIDRHIVAQVIEAELVVRDIRDVAAVLHLPLFAAHAVEYDADGHSHKVIDLSHPLRVTLGQVIVDCDDMDASALQSVEIGGHCGDQRLTFTCAHLGDAALV